MSDRTALIAFFGSDAIAVPSLDALASQGAGPAIVVSQPDRPVGRGKKLTPNPVAAWARDRDIPLLQPDKPDAALVAALAEAGIALSVVMAYGHFLGKVLREQPRCGMWNLHASLLPAYRGASPIQAALAEGCAQSGVSLMAVERRMDAGAVVDAEVVDCKADETGGSLHAKLAQAAARLLTRRLEDLLASRVEAVPQEETSASFCRKLRREDGQLDFERPAIELAARIRALDPWPSCFVTVEGQRLKVAGARAREGQGRAGEVLGLVEGCLEVACGEGVLVIPRWQRPGGRWLEADAFLRGFSLETGRILESAPMPALVSPEPFPGVAK